ncbi:hypothetical protein GEV33_006322 [Tenebrio molitor]|uniref:Uncharacterized protein n=1 Tax=Tenebrio molitor TaxID=7067 RepID=A0A8J6HKS6_TENMO|nr:hypothetical protein GEV33_006322 [Tenebrio molitor]
MSYGQISTNLGLSKSTIHAIMRKWEHTGTVVRRPGSGRRRVSSVEQNEAVINILQNRPLSNGEEEVAITHLPVSDDAFWSRVVFSDEKTFQSCPNGRIRVYRPRNTRYEERYVDATDRNEWPFFCKYVSLDFGGESRAELFPNHEVPDLPDERLWFQQDGPPPHYSETEGGYRMAAARSPDLTPMDYFLWGYPKSKVYDTKPENLEDLRQRIVNEDIVKMFKDNILNICSSVLKGRAHEYYVDWRPVQRTWDEFCSDLTVAFPDRETPGARAYTAATLRSRDCPSLSDYGIQKLRTIHRFHSALPWNTILSMVEYGLDQSEAQAAIRIQQPSANRELLKLLTDFDARQRKHQHRATQSGRSHDLTGANSSNKRRPSSSATPFKAVAARQGRQGFFDVSEDRTADALYTLITNVLAPYEFKSKLVAQCYDGASVMAGSLNRLQMKIKERFKMHSKLSYIFRHLNIYSCLLQPVC